MKHTSNNWILVSSGVLWLFAIAILWGSWHRDIGLPYAEAWLLLPLVLVIKDIMVYVAEVSPLQTQRITRNKIHKDNKLGLIPSRYSVALLNRTYVFPIILTLYLVYLLIEQTGVFGLEYSIWFLAADDQLLLVITIISGIFLVLGEKRDAQYITTSPSMISAWGYTALSIFLALIGGYIILKQVLTLGRVGVAIANIAGILIFLVGILLLDEEEGTHDDTGFVHTKK